MQNITCKEKLISQCKYVTDLMEMLKLHIQPVAWWY